MTDADARRALNRVLPRGLGSLLLAIVSTMAGSAVEATDSVTPSYASHSPMRPLPTASSRPLAGGPSHFVDPVRGVDDGPGTREAPWRTVQHALARLRPGETLYLRAGVYHERIRARPRGEPESPITVRSYPGELAILDGGFEEFLLRPAEAWEPFEAGAPGEYRSRRPYPEAGPPQGWFGDSMVPLHAYRAAADLRSDNELWIDHQVPRYCGPGLWLDPKTDRIHIRLAPTELSSLAEKDRYRGASDPRGLPLVIGGGDLVTLRLDGARNLVLQDLVIRGAGRAALLLEDSRAVRLEGLTVLSGLHALEMEGNEGVRIFDSVFRGNAAPWSFRSSLKYRGVASVLVLTRGLLSKNRKLEIAYSEFTDGHDGIFLGEASEVDFHHNLVDNFNDDGLFLTSRIKGGREIRIFQNRLSRCLTTFAFGWGRGLPNLPGEGAHLFRNVIDLQRPVAYFPPRPGAPPGKVTFGRVSGDHGSPVWEPLSIYHNTFLAKRMARPEYAMGWGSHLEGTSRKLFNNIFVTLEQRPRAPQVSPESNLETDGNLHWGRQAGATPGDDPLEAFRGTPAFTASRERHPPGWEANGRVADPRFKSLGSAEEPVDLRLRPDSPAVDAGVDLPEGLPDPLRQADRGRPDIGALPLGSPALTVGPRR